MQAGRPRPAILRSESVLVVGMASMLAFLYFGDSWLSDLSGGLWYSFLFVWLFAVMLSLAFGVVRHADGLAVLLGEPYGTLILTVSVISIEVIMISAVMLTGESNPTLARDTLFSVLMIVLNGMVGITLLLGSLRHHEQSYNLKGASAYLAVIRSNESLQSGNIINIGGGRELQVRRLVALVQEIMGTDLPIVSRMSFKRPTEIQRNFCDNIEAKELIGWEPQTDIQAGLKKTIPFLIGQWEQIAAARS